MSGTVRIHLDCEDTTESRNERHALQAAESGILLCPW